MRSFCSEGLLPTFRGRKHRFSFDLTATAYDGARLSCNFHIFFTACTLQNSHVEALAHGKIKSERKSLVKKKKKKNEKEILDQKERVPFCQEKKKISSWQRPVLAELCAGVQVSNIKVAVKPKFATHNVKKEVPFLYTSTSLIHKHWKSPWTVILKAVCRFVVLPLCTFCGFLHFCRGFCLCLS